MAQRMKVWVTIAAIAIVAVIAVVIVNINTSHKGNVIIGRILPLTGEAASYGKSEQKGTLLALEEVNANDGIGGKSLEILFEDSRSSVKDGVNAMKKLVEINKVPAVLGETVSGITLAIAPIANEREVLLLSPLSSAAAITNAGPFVCRVMPSDAFQSRILAAWIFSEGHKRIAMLYVNNAWGKGVSEEFEREYGQLGGVIACTEVCDVNDREFRTQLVKLRDAKPAALFCAMMPQGGGILLKQLRELGMKLPVYGADAWSVDDLLTTAGDAAEGIKYTYPAQFTGEAYQSFAAAFQAKFGGDPDVNAAGAYDAVQILALCMNRLVKKGELLTGANIRKEIAGVKDYQGATGTTTFDEHGDSIAKTFDKMIIRDGKRVRYGN